VSVSVLVLQVNPEATPPAHITFVAAAGEDVPDDITCDTLGGLPLTPGAFGDPKATTDDLLDQGKTLFGIFCLKVQAALASHIGRIEIDAAGQASAQPWEILVANEQFLFLDPDRTLAIRLPGGGARSARPRIGPLRILIIVGSKDGDKQVLALDELKVLQDALDRYPSQTQVSGRADMLVNLQVRPTVALFTKKLQDFQPQVLHFIGHAYAAGTHDAHLFVHDGDPARWTANVLKAPLQQAKHCLRLVFLNACDTGALEPGQLNELVDEFFIAGVHAVIGNRVEVLGTASGDVASAVYHGLAKGRPVDEALREARIVLSSRAGRHWAAPRLYIRDDGGDLPQLKRSRPNGFSVTKLGNCPVLARTQVFVRRYEERWHGWQKLIERDLPHLLVVHGTAGAGRTDVVKLLLEYAAMSGRMARYIDFDHQPTNWLDALRMIRDVGPHPNTATRKVLNAEWPGDPFARFTVAVNAATDPAYNGGALPDEPDGAPDNYQPWNSKVEQRIDDLFSRFRDGLGALASDDAGVVIAVDNTRDLGGTSMDALRNGLFDFYDEEEINQSIKLILSLDSDPYRDIVESYENRSMTLEIKENKAEDFAKICDALRARIVPRLPNDEKRSSFNTWADNHITGVAEDDVMYVAQDLEQVYSAAKKRGWTR